VENGKADELTQLRAESQTGVKKMTKIYEIVIDEGKVLRD